MRRSAQSQRADLAAIVAASGTDVQPPKRGESAVGARTRIWGELSQRGAHDPARQALMVDEKAPEVVPQQ